VILVSPYLQHTDAAVWGPDADEWRPERWEDPAGAAESVHAYSYMPFSRGPRWARGGRAAGAAALPAARDEQLPVCCCAPGCRPLAAAKACRLINRRPHPSALAHTRRSRRDCIGARFAMLEAKTILAMVYQRFRLTYAGDGPEKLLISVTVHPSQGVPVRVTRRE
jgi:cytochrome P450